MNGFQSPSAIAGGPDHHLLKCTVTTWHRDSHELFDYESRHTCTKQFLIPKAARVYRVETDVKVLGEGLPPPNEADYLLSIRCKDGKFSVWPADRSGCNSTTIQPKKLWLIIRHLPKACYSLSESDVVKLGRFKLRVKQIQTDPSVSGTPIEFKLDDGELPVTHLAPAEAEVTQCRICLLEGATEDDPLVRPCQCRGSIMYVHVECLRHWVNGRLNLLDDQSRTCCFIKQLQCELCKSFLPSAVLHGTNRLAIVKVPNIQPPFIVLENLVGLTNRGVHVCSMAMRKECKLGRGHESDVRIPDVSISRFHAMIRFADGSFFLEDHSSKFGTLVALRRPQNVEKNDGLAVQVGRTVLHFNLEEFPKYSSIDEIMELEEGDPHTLGPKDNNQGGENGSSNNNNNSSMPTENVERKTEDTTAVLGDNNSSSSSSQQLQQQSRQQQMAVHAVVAGAPTSTNYSSNAPPSWVGGEHHQFEGTSNVNNNSPSAGGGYAFTAGNLTSRTGRAATYMEDTTMANGGVQSEVSAASQDSHSGSIPQLADNITTTTTVGYPIGRPPPTTSSCVSNTAFLPPSAVEVNNTNNILPYPGVPIPGGAHPPDSRTSSTHQPPPSASVFGTSGHQPNTNSPFTDSSISGFLSRQTNANAANIVFGSGGPGQPPNFVSPFGPPSSGLNNQMNSSQMPNVLGGVDNPSHTMPAHEHANSSSANNDYIMANHSILPNNHAGGGPLTGSSAAEDEPMNSLWQQHNPMIRSFPTTIPSIPGINNNNPAERFPSNSISPAYNQHVSFGPIVRTTRYTDSSTAPQVGSPTERAFRQLIQLQQQQSNNSPNNNNSHEGLPTHQPPNTSTNPGAGSGTAMSYWTQNNPVIVPSLGLDIDGSNSNTRRQLAQDQEMTNSNTSHMVARNATGDQQHHHHHHHHGGLMQQPNSNASTGTGTGGISVASSRSRNDMQQILPLIGDKNALIFNGSTHIS